LKAYIRTSQQVQLEARQKAQSAWFDAAKRHSQQPTVNPAVDSPKKSRSKSFTTAKSKRKSKK
jgi:hypothetical protein